MRMQALASRDEHSPDYTFLTSQGVALSVPYNACSTVKLTGCLRLTLSASLTCRTRSLSEQIPAASQQHHAICTGLAKGAATSQTLTGTASSAAICQWLHQNMLDSVMGTS